MFIELSKGEVNIKKKFNFMYDLFIEYNNMAIWKILSETHFAYMEYV